MLKAIVLVAALLTCTSAMAFDYPDVNCTLNADSSRVLIIASNPTDQTYQCMAQCKANVSGQRAFEPIDCRFNLSANSAEKTECSSNDRGPNGYTAISPTRSVCRPR